MDLALSLQMKAVLASVSQDGDGISLGAWGPDDFSVSATGTSGQLRLDIAQVPTGADDLQYDIDESDAWVSLGSNQPGAYFINNLTDGQSYTIRPRASNSGGSATISGKSAAPSVVLGDWAPDDFNVSATGTSGQLRLDILQVPAGTDDLQYDIDGSDAWVSLGSNQPGAYFVGGQTDDVRIEVQLRAANNDGSTTISTSRNVTPATFSQTAEIIVTNRSASQVAPEAFFFEISLNGFDSAAPSGGTVKDDRLHDIYYFWDFDDSYAYSKPLQIVDLGVHSDANKCYGPIGSHTYRAPGTYTVSCLCVEPSSGKSATATLDVTVGNPNTLFLANNQTLVLDSTGTGLAAYPNATVVTSWATMISTLNGYNDGVARRVFVRKGQAFTLPSTAINLGKNANWGTTHILAADEPGNDPEFTLDSTINWYDNFKSPGSPKDFVMQGIKLFGPWDSTTESGGQVNALAVNKEPPQMYLIDRCEIDGFLHCFYGNGWPTSAVKSYYFNDNLWTNWRFYGAIDGSADHYVMTGCSIRQAQLANAGGVKSTGVNNAHSGLRIAKNPKELIHSCEFYSRNDWFASNGIWGQQPNLRYDTDGIGDGYTSIQCNVFEGGNNLITYGTETGQIANLPGNFLVEKNYFLATHSTRKMVTLNKGGTTFRNNVMVVPDTPQYSGYTCTTALNSNWDGLSAANRDEEQQFYSNTIINLSDTSITETDTSGFTALTNANNVFHEPNSGSPNTTDGPLDSTSQFTPYELGYKHNVSYGDGLHVLQTAYATPANNTWLGAPLTGSGAIGDALNGPVAYDDFYGNRRPQYPSRGAFEMA